MRNKILKWICTLGCGIALLCSFAACSTEAETQSTVESTAESASWNPTGAATTEEGYYELDILQNIDMSTVTQEGNCVYFDVYLSPEQAIHFGGIDVTVENGTVTLNPNGMLFSLDYMGQMRYLNISTDNPDCWIYPHLCKRCQC